MNFGFVFISRISGIKKIDKNGFYAIFVSSDNKNPRRIVMQKSNNLLNKYLLKDYVAIGAFSLVAGLSALYLGKFIKLGNEIEKEYEQEKILNTDIKKPEMDSTSPLLCMALVLGCGLLVFNSIDGIKYKKEKTLNIGRKFLQDLLKESNQPERKNEIRDSSVLSERQQIITAMHEFDAVLSNPRALAAAMTVICNTLTESEQNEIAKIANEFDLIPVKRNREYKMKARDVRDAIFKIVKQHESIDPGFMSTILMALANANTTYIMPMQQKAR